MNTSIIELDLAYKPEQLFYLLKDRDYFCFLDSSLSQSYYSKFSYIAFDPDFILKSHGFKNQFIDLRNKTTRTVNVHPLKFLNKNFSKFIDFNSENMNTDRQFLYVDKKNNDFIIKESNKHNIVTPDFKCGFIGYFSYDLKNFLEELPQNSYDDLNIPVFFLLYFKQVLAYNHINKKWYLTRIFNEEPGEDNKNTDNFKILKKKTIENKKFFLDLLKHNQTQKIIEKDISTKNCDNENCFPLKDAIRENIAENYLKKDIKTINLKSNFKKEDYIKAIKKAKKYIHGGDIYQINLTQRFGCSIPVQSADLYYILRYKNPAPFSAYLNLREVKIGSSSPERFLYIKKDYIETRPIKGTRPRGKDEEEDVFYEHELQNSIKDRAELNMIVDLERNDLGKFCSYGSVKVSEHAKIERYARVIHSVSTVTGEIKNGINLSNIIKASFPGGSITGTPKIRAMQIIDELEPTVRNIYTGSIGYIGIDGTTDLNIAIRTFIITGNNFYYNAGGGIVEDSNPEDEFNETLDKGRALEEALKFFETKNLKNILKK
ncbi:MAG: anthranilate synthase component I family protein [Actinobacteria bacterium]|nr:anthranilate synthase component I family protein [Actinomycetota bacterium]